MNLLFDGRPWVSHGTMSKNHDRTFPLKQDNLNNATVYIGGVQADVTYAGRSQYPGVDQIDVVVPSLGATRARCWMTMSTLSGRIHFALTAGRRSSKGLHFAVVIRKFWIKSTRETRSKLKARLQPAKVLHAPSACPFHRRELRPIYDLHVAPYCKTSRPWRTRTKSSKWTGLVMKSSMPASAQRSRLPVIASAVNAMMRTFRFAPVMRRICAEVS